MGVGHYIMLHIEWWPNWEDHLHDLKFPLRANRVAQRICHSAAIGKTQRSDHPIHMIIMLINIPIKIFSWICQLLQGQKNASDPHIDWDDQAREHLFLSLWRGVRHETGERSMIKVGLTSHPGIKRIKPRVYYAAPKTLLLCWSTVAPLYWFFKWGLIGSDPPDPSTKYLRF